MTTTAVVRNSNSGNNSIINSDDMEELLKAFLVTRFANGRVEICSTTHGTKKIPTFASWSS